MIYYWRRIGAYVIDLSIIGMFSQLAFSLIGHWFILTGTNLLVDVLMIYLFLMFSVGIAVGYNVLCYHYFKFPLGKLLMGIKVYNHRKRRVSTKDYALREFNKYVFMYATIGLYAPYQFIRYVWPKKQTFHDRQANTHIYF